MKLPIPGHSSCRVPTQHTLVPFLYPCLQGSSHLVRIVAVSGSMPFKGLLEVQSLLPSARRETAKYCASMYSIVDKQ